MDKNEILEKTLKAFQRYYNIKRDAVTEPFSAEAEFHTHDEHYFLSKSAKIFESESNEFVFFALEDELDKNTLHMLDQRAWEEGLSRVDLEESHKSSDVTLIIIADRVQDEAFQMIPKLKHYKSYLFTLRGWSNYRLITLEVSTGKISHNRQGGSLKKLLSNIVAE